MYHSDEHGVLDMKQRKCPQCGSSDIEVSKTWNLISPLPDSQGRITVTVMGVYRCRACGYNWRGVVSKLKIGEGIEIAGKEELVEKRPPKEIILDIEEIRRES